MKYIISILMLLTLTSCSNKDSAQVKYKEQYTKIAEAMAPKIPKGSRVALKMTSPEKNGLPEAFLQKLMAEFSGALVKSSNSNFVILNRNSTEDIWKEAIEFNNQDLEKITTSAEADVSITLSPKINESGIDLSVTAYSLKEGSTGNILASASELIQMNVKAELGVDVKSLDKKIDQLSQLIDKDKAAQSNELSDIFTLFSQNPGLNSMARVFPSGCDKPVKLTKEDGFKIRCEVYRDGNLIVLENIDFNKLLDIDIINGPSRGSVNSLKIYSNTPNDLAIPSKMNQFKKLIACDSSGYASGGDRFYSISIPNSKPFYVLHNWSSGSGGTWSSLTLFYDSNTLPKKGDGQYVMAGQLFPDPPQPGWRCE